MEIRECNSCDWVGYVDDCFHPKHQQSLMLCPDCKETTFVITPEHIASLNLEIEESGR
jgi:NAD-dependent SIR2 family protein deacetylase